MTKYVEELIAIIRGNLSREELIDRLFDYHDNDIAEALELLTPEERKRLYSALGAERVAEIFAYLDDGDIYLKELSLKQQAKVISEMDSDDAVDILEEVDDDTKCKILGMLDKEASEDVRLLLSYDEDEIGSYMTTNFILIHNDLTVREAMREVRLALLEADVSYKVVKEFVRPEKMITFPRSMWWIGRSSTTEPSSCRI